MAETTGACPQVIHELVKRFEEHHEAYRKSDYKEAELRREFLDPFFEALGWDISNKSGKSETFKDVVLEEALKIGGTTKAPDYAFRIGGARLFFVEAKKPSHDLQTDSAPAYQLRRYAWNAKLALSILTDFEEFAIYDCRVKPSVKDKSPTARILYLNFKDYAARWNEIAGLLSREAVERGSLERFKISEKGKRGTSAVDDEFLKDIERWRDLLARNLALRNRRIGELDLNTSVQRILDRIVFLRICEDRGVEKFRQLQDIVSGRHIYRELCNLFQRADERYNSGLFHFHKEKDRSEPPDELTLQLKVDDAVLKEIITHLYYPESPYEFSVISLDILGNIYEQFLGKVIRMTKGHHAVVEEKPEVKKAGGVYYTPTYIVDYIVKNTVGKLCEGKTPKEIAALRILDPACGSGSFLIGAYTFLLNLHLDWYLKDGVGKHGKEVYQVSKDRWRLTTQEKKRILLNNIYGVDIDRQAVEVTKLSLLLKVLEGENQQSIEQQMTLFHERALPDLGSNIKCGNSLIGPDYFQGQLIPDKEELRRVNAFDWPAEFPAILGWNLPDRRRGFDAVIGNPPYIRMEAFKPFKGYFKSSYAVHEERSDIYAYFMEKGHKVINSSGKFGMIVSNKFLRANYGTPLREFLSANAQIDRVVDFAGLPVFKGATVRTIVLFSSRDKHSTRPALYSPPPAVERFKQIESGLLSVTDAVRESTYEVSPTALGHEVWSFPRRNAERLLAKIRAKCIPLATFCDGQICRGVVSGLTEAFMIDAKTCAAILRRNPRAAEIIKPFLNGRDVRRYTIESQNKFLIYTYHGVPIEKYPAVEKHLEPFKSQLVKRATKQAWYELQQPQLNFAPFMDGTKIIFPDIATEPRFALDETGYYSSNTTYFIPRQDTYLLALLNSRLAHYYFKTACAGLEGKNETYLRFFGQYLEGFPVRAMNASDHADKVRHDRMVALVERMLDLHKRLAAAKGTDDKTPLQRQIAATDREIDQLVYELYNLTPAEIKIVEEGSTVK